MSRRFLAFAALLCLPWNLGWGQSRIGEWQHYTSTISPQDIAFHEGRVYAATGGGVLIFDPVTETFSTLGVSDRLVYTDLKCLAISDGWLWLGGALPCGVIQIVNLASGRMKPVDLDLDEILHIVVRQDRAFAAFKDGQDAGLVEFRWDGQEYSFADIYRNFPLTVTDIRDLDLYGDSLYVTTDVGVLGNHVVLANLKDPLTWVVMTPTERDDIVQYLVDSTGHYFMVPRELHRRSEGGWSVYRTFGGGTLRHLMRRSNGDFVISYSRYVRFLTTSGGLFASRMAESHVLAYVDSDDEDIGYVIFSDGGLARYDHTTRGWTPLKPNTMASKICSSVLKLKTGDLIASGPGGISRFNGKSWYCLMPSYWFASGREEDRIHDNYAVESSPFFLADTIYYHGKQSWNLLELPDGDLLVGFKGNPHTGAGIMRVDINDVAGYMPYDTAGGALDGLHDATRDFVFITIRNMVPDAAGNIWIANPFSPLKEHVLAVYTTGEDWEHFTPEESGNALNMAPTEIAFDGDGRVWVGSEVTAYWGSPGGIAVLDYGPTLEDKTDDQWTRVSARLEPDHSNTVWSLIFDRNQVLWTVTPDGIMGYYVDPGLTLRPFTNFGPFLREIPFVEGSKIRVDAQNNKWITTPQHGLWVLLDNTTFWPSVEGINVGNSALISDEILDIFLDDDEGVAYLATSKGISALKIPFKKELAHYDELVIFPSPYRIPSDRELIVDGLRQGSTVKIFTVSGRLVRELTALDGSVQGYQAAWDGKNAAGEWVGSGVYLIVAYLESGRSGVGKVAVIRR
ncbi:MAG: hypothetical protein ACETWG_00285 [Candidatus Neomarinimicrobiota bacterium]